MTFPARGTAHEKFKNVRNFMLAQRQPYSLLCDGAGKNRVQGHRHHQYPLQRAVKIMLRGLGFILDSVESPPKLLEQAKL